MQRNDQKRWTVGRVVKEIAIMVILIVIISNFISYIRQPILSGSQLPAINEILISGETVRSEAFRGKPLLIHFWATWCPVCKAEVDNIERLSKRYEVVTFAVRSGSDEEIKAYLQKRGLHYRVINDQEGNWAARFNVKGFPTTFIYDSNGVLSSSEVGYTSTAGLVLRMWSAD